MLLPAIATAALGTALLVPLRDNRRGRRATLPAGAAPLRPHFAAAAADAAAPEALAPKSDADALADAPVSQPASHKRPPGGASLPEPFAILTAFAKFFDIRSWQRIPARGAVTSDEIAPDDAALQGPSVVVERSFAAELASLVGGNRQSNGVSEPTQTADVALPVRECETKSSDWEPGGATNDRRPERATGRESEGVTNERRPEVETPKRESGTGASESGTVASDSGTVASDSTRERALAGVRVEGSERPADAGLEPAEAFAVPSAPGRVERIVPLTRLRLRPQATTVTWPAMCGALAASENGASRPERHALLERFARDIASVTSGTIELAYREEDPSGRALALRVMLRHFPNDGRSLFIEAVRNGSDEERAVAIDGLAAIEAREELTVAFGDRLDALAAKAALAYVGSYARAEYRDRLAPYADAARIEAILKLLAGIVE